MRKSWEDKIVQAVLETKINIRNYINKKIIFNLQHQLINNDSISNNKNKFNSKNNNNFSIVRCGNLSNNLNNIQN